MKEKFLQTLWKNKVFNPLNFRDTEGNAIEILEFGVINPNSGPDFHSAKIRTQNLTFYGNIEIHIKSSDWYAHKHQYQKEYESIILHIVFEHDKDIPELKTRNIPTIELKNYINPNFLSLEKFHSNAEFIACEKIFNIKKIPPYFYKEIILQKLTEKDKEIQQSLKLSKNNFEAVLFQKIAYTFGLKVNADIFLNTTQNIDFKIIKKVSQNPFQLESLFFGTANLLHEDITDSKPWQKGYEFLQKKFQLNEINFPAQFLRLMPASFPTIRLSQLAILYHTHQNLFSKIIHAKNTQELKAIFQNITTTPYWENHFIFGKETSQKRKKTLSSDFIDIILINAIFPIIYTYHKNESNILDKMYTFYKSLKPEKNSIIKKWKNLGADIQSALDSQAFLYLYKNYCSQKKCTNCPQINF